MSIFDNLISGFDESSVSSRAKTEMEKALRENKRIQEEKKRQRQEYIEKIKKQQQAIRDSVKGFVSNVDPNNEFNLWEGKVGKAPERQYYAENEQPLTRFLPKSKETNGKKVNPYTSFLEKNKDRFFPETRESLVQVFHPDTAYQIEKKNGNYVPVINDKRPFPFEDAYSNIDYIVENDNTKHIKKEMKEAVEKDVPYGGPLARLDKEYQKAVKDWVNAKEGNGTTLFPGVYSYYLENKTPKWANSAISDFRQQKILEALLEEAVQEREKYNASTDRQIFDYLCKRVLAQWAGDEENWNFAQEQLRFLGSMSSKFLENVGFSQERAKGILKDKFILDPTNQVALGDIDELAELYFNYFNGDPKAALDKDYYDSLNDYKDKMNFLASVVHQEFGYRDPQTGLLVNYKERNKEKLEKYLSDNLWGEAIRNHIKGIRENIILPSKLEYTGTGWSDALKFSFVNGPIAGLDGLYWCFQLAGGIVGDIVDVVKEAYVKGVSNSFMPNLKEEGTLDDLMYNADLENSRLGATKVKESMFNSNNTDPAELKEYKKTLAQDVTTEIKKYLAQSNGYYNRILKQGDPDNILSGLDYKLLAAQYIFDSQYLGADAAAQHLLDAVDIYLYEKSTSFGSAMSNAADLFGASAASVAGSTVAVLAAAGSGDESKLYNSDIAKWSSNVMKSGDIFGSHSDWEELPPELLIASYENVRDPRERGEIFLGEWYNVVGELTGQYGFTAATMSAGKILNTAGKTLSGISKVTGATKIANAWRLKTLMNKALAKSVDEIATRALALSKFTPANAQRLAARSLKERAKKLLDKATYQGLTKTSTYKEVGKQIAAAPVKFDNWAQPKLARFFATRYGIGKMFKNVPENITKWYPELAGDNTLVEDIVKKIPSYDTLKNRAITHMLGKKVRGSKVRGWLLAGFLGSTEGAIEAQSTFEEIMASLKTLTDDAWKNSHAAIVDNERAQLLQQTDLLDLEIEDNKFMYDPQHLLDRYELQLQYTSNPEEKAALQEQYNSYLQQLRELAVEGLLDDRLRMVMQDDEQYQLALVGMQATAEIAAKLNFLYNSMINGAILHSLKVGTLDKKSRQIINQRRQRVLESVRFEKTENALTLGGIKAVVNREATKKSSLALKKWLYTPFKTGLGEGLEEWLQNMSNTTAQNIGNSVYAQYLMHAFNPEAKDALYRPMSKELGSSISDSIVAPTILTILPQYLPETVEQGIKAVKDKGFSTEAITEFVYGALSGTGGSGVAPNVNFLRGVLAETAYAGKTAAANVRHMRNKGNRLLAKMQARHQLDKTLDALNISINSQRDLEREKTFSKDFDFESGKTSNDEERAYIDSIKGKNRWSKAVHWWSRWQPLVFSGGLQGSINIEREAEKINKIIVDGINSTLKEGNNKGIWNLITPGISLQGLYDKALGTSEEGELRDFQHSLMVHSALILDLAIGNSEAGKAYWDLINTWKNMDLQQLKFDGEGKLIFDGVEKREQNGRNIYAIDEYNIAAEMIRLYAAGSTQNNSTDNSGISQQKMIESVKSNAEKLASLVQEVHVLSKEYERLFGDTISTETKTALIHGRLRHDNLVERRDGLEKIDEEFYKQGNFRKVSSFGRYQNDLPKAIANFGSYENAEKELQAAEKKLVELNKAIKGPILNRAETLEKIRETQKLIDEAQEAKRVFNGYNEYRRQLLAQNESTEESEETISPEDENVIGKTAQLVTSKKSSRTSLSKKSKEVLLTLADIMALDYADRSKMLKDRNNASKYSPAQRRILQRLVDKGNKYYRRRAEKNNEVVTVSPFEDAMHDVAYLDAQIKQNDAEFERYLRHPEDLEVLGAYLKENSDYHMLIAGMDDLIIDKPELHSSMSKWNEAYVKKQRELASKRGISRGYDRAYKYLINKKPAALRKYSNILDQVRRINQNKGIRVTLKLRFRITAALLTIIDDAKNFNANNELITKLLSNGGRLNLGMQDDKVSKDRLIQLFQKAFGKNNVTSESLENSNTVENPDNYSKAQSAPYHNELEKLLETLTQEDPEKNKKQIEALQKIIDEDLNRYFTDDQVRDFVETFLKLLQSEKKEEEKIEKETSSQKIEEPLNASTKEEPKPVTLEEPAGAVDLREGSRYLLAMFRDVVSGKVNWKENANDSEWTKSLYNFLLAEFGWTQEKFDEFLKRTAGRRFLLEKTKIKSIYFDGRVVTLAVYEHNGTEYLVGIIPVSLEENNNQLTTTYATSSKATIINGAVVIPVDGKVIEEAAIDPITNKPYHFLMVGIKGQEKRESHDILDLENSPMVTIKMENLKALLEIENRPISPENITNVFWNSVVEVVKNLLNKKDKTMTPNQDEILTLDGLVVTTAKAPSLTSIQWFVKDDNGNLEIGSAYDYIKRGVEWALNNPENPDLNPYRNKKDPVYIKSLATVVEVILEGNWIGKLHLDSANDIANSGNGLNTAKLVLVNTVGLSSYNLFTEKTEKELFESWYKEAKANGNNPATMSFAEACRSLVNNNAFKDLALAVNGTYLLSEYLDQKKDLLDSSAVKNDYMLSLFALGLYMGRQSIPSTRTVIQIVDPSKRKTSAGVGLLGSGTTVNGSGGAVDMDNGNPVGKVNEAAVQASLINKSYAAAKSVLNQVKKYCDDVYQRVKSSGLGLVQTVSGSRIAPTLDISKVDSNLLESLKKSDSYNEKTGKIEEFKEEGEILYGERAGGFGNNVDIYQKCIAEVIGSLCENAYSSGKENWIGNIESLQNDISRNNMFKQQVKEKIVEVLNRQAGRLRFGLENGVLQLDNENISWPGLAADYIFDAFINNSLKNNYIPLIRLGFVPYSSNEEIRLATLVDNVCAYGYPDIIFYKFDSKEDKYQYLIVDVKTFRYEKDLTTEIQDNKLEKKKGTWAVQTNSYSDMLDCALDKMGQLYSNCCEVVAPIIFPSAISYAPESTQQQEISRFYSNPEQAKAKGESIPNEAVVTTKFVLASGEEKSTGESIYGKAVKVYEAVNPSSDDEEAIRNEGLSLNTRLELTVAPIVIENQLLGRCPILPYINTALMGSSIDDLNGEDEASESKFEDFSQPLLKAKLTKPVVERIDNSGFLEDEQDEPFEESEEEFESAGSSSSITEEDIKEEFNDEDDFTPQDAFGTNLEESRTTRAGERLAYKLTRKIKWGLPLRKKQNSKKTPLSKTKIVEKVLEKFINDTFGFEGCENVLGDDGIKIKVNLNKRRWKEKISKALTERLPILYEGKIEQLKEYEKKLASELGLINAAKSFVAGELSKEQLDERFLGYLDKEVIKIIDNLKNVEDEQSLQKKIKQLEDYFNIDEHRLNVYLKIQKLLDLKEALQYGGISYYLFQSFDEQRKAVLEMLNSKDKKYKYIYEDDFIDATLDTQYVLYEKNNLFQETKEFLELNGVHIENLENSTSTAGYLLEKLADKYKNGNDLEQDTDPRGIVLRNLSSILQSTAVSVQFVYEEDAHQNRSGWTDTFIAESEEGEYAQSKIHINLANITSVEDLARALAHESIHAITMFTIQQANGVTVGKETINLRDELDSLIGYIRDVMTSNDIDPETVYGLRSPEEFVAEFFSNPLFLYTLRRLPLESDNVFKRVCNTISRFLFRKKFKTLSAYEKIEKKMEEIMAVSIARRGSGTVAYIKNEEEKNRKEISKILENRRKMFSNFNQLPLAVKAYADKLGITDKIYDALPYEVQDYIKFCCE